MAVPSPAVRISVPGVTTSPGVAVRRTRGVSTNTAPDTDWMLASFGPVSFWARKLPLMGRMVGLAWVGGQATRASPVAEPLAVPVPAMLPGADSVRATLHAPEGNEVLT